mmetsp:Transcript_26048/g.56861  ORF Transcript_26048/g.56861 Transcript_26048/m.56861 type:complete len:197 (-) Transcript_26048:954-1544(-)|eukprot:CAMPEP_0202901720 /NCGR_PEP_ID=MMETSP1392-20130828/14421_1 /ASSEMBLY_ACC=CAM_ASM_000868 /TAXON_ID=225041 /ORGANISM="Chlamydomonas chlamydogama, Strain SAG 11-48b" /LENGTH=196 /DNA_ID=CAMNT_0049588329 /DNA_START=62 /DNA_END=652 /DNA_ORIENTATION=+
MAEGLTVKVCVVGPCKAGKTLLCRALAEQPIIAGEYHPTAAVRIQEFSRTIGVDRARVQLWDCSGSNQYQAYWSVLAKDLDGIVMIIDPAKPEQERELEQFYMNFAQPHGLTKRQCLIMGIQIVKEGSYGLGGWQGLQGKLNQLNSTSITLNPASPQAGVQEAFQALDKLLLGCLAHKKDLMERSVVEDEHQEPQQ